MEDSIQIQKAKLGDVPTLLAIIDRASKAGHILPRSLSYLYDNVRDFWVARQEAEIVGCGSLHICWEDLAEVKSVVVQPEHRGRGLGRRLVTQCVDEATAFGIARVFVLTYVPDFFR